jgi:hypothetical protein
MFRERVVLPHGVVLEIVFFGQADWKLSLRKDERRLVEYSSASGYEFKSVEKLRYDFERDVEKALRRG